MTVNTLTLPNGVRIVSERLPYVRSATLGVWFGCGSRYETANINGVSHFIEHMLFKGTSNFTAAQLAERMDELGGGFNAFTSKEATSFYVKSLDTNILESAKVLCEMIFDSSFDPRELETERSVIFEEIDMYEDTPDDLAAERLTAGAFKGSPLSRPILGKRSTLEKMTPDTLRDYMRQHYMGKNTVVSIS
ncbi:MAG: insulinase family protein, partial [Clostridiales bacterium]|nr:insulinase family protein [Clostridiales bacterium]